MNCLIISNLFIILEVNRRIVLSCMFLFLTSAYQGSRAKILITQLYPNWKDTREDLKNHCVLEYHKDSMQKMNSFLSCFKDPTARIDQSISQTSAAVVSRNRQYIASILRAILNCLEAISLNNDLNNRSDPHSVTEASGLRKQLRSSSFIVGFQTCKYLYGYTKGLSQQLQGSIVEIAQSYEIVSVVAAQLNDICDDDASEFQNVFTECQAMAALADTTITVPRTVSRKHSQQHWNI